MKVFISYTLKDGEIRRGLLKKINGIKSCEKLKLFIDVLHNNDPNPQLRIENEIKNSDILILIGTKNVFQSNWVRKEVLLARKRNLPIYIDHPQNIVRTLKSVYDKVYNS